MKSQNYTGLMDDRIPLVSSNHLEFIAVVDEGAFSALGYVSGDKKLFLKRHEAKITAAAERRLDPGAATNFHVYLGARDFSEGSRSL